MIQEYLLAQAVNTMFNGDQVDDELFKDWLARETGLDLEMHEIATKKSEKEVQPYQALSLVAGRHLELHPSVAQPLYDLLLRHKNSNCSDPRDRVFALLSLIPSEERELIGRVLPDYSLCEDEVIVITLSHLIRFRSSIGESVSQEVFTALRVGEGHRRKRLWNAAQCYDCVDLPNSIEWSSEPVEDIYAPESLLTEIVRPWKWMSQVLPVFGVSLVAGYFIYKRRV